MGRAFNRTLSALTRMLVRAGTRAFKQAVSTPRPARAKKVSRKTLASPRSARASKTAPSSTVVANVSGSLHYQLFVPSDIAATERIPLVVMLHGCGQDAQMLAASTRMNTVATREHFAVLYPEQNRMANLQGCWNWFQTRNGQAQTEADAILAAIDQVCRGRHIDGARIAIAGLSAGAGMAALVATRLPSRFAAVAMHSGIVTGLANSTATALRAMRGTGKAAKLPAQMARQLPALLVIQGTADGVVAPVNGSKAALLWAEVAGATATPPRTVQRGRRYATTVTDYLHHGRLVSTLCAIDRLGHAWSGGAARQSLSDPLGPDASRMIWAFAAKQFAYHAAIRQAC